MQHYSPTLPIATVLFGLTGMLIAAPVVVPDFEIADGAAATLDRFGSSLARGPGYLAIGSPLSDSPTQRWKSHHRTANLDWAARRSALPRKHNVRDD